MIKLPVGFKQLFAVIVRDVYGNEVTEYSTPVWTFSNDFAVIDDNGLLTAGTVVGEGVVKATIAVKDASIYGTVDVSVVPGEPVSVEVITVDEPSVD